MSRLTGSDALGLYGAYQAVYAPQELTEEQVWEEVETWVNDLIEEGYDLSDYTWEEMFEAYIEENTNDGIGSANTPAAAAQLKQRSRNIAARGGGFGQIGRGLTRMFGSGDQIKREDELDKADRAREKAALTGASKKQEKQGPYVPDRLKKAPPTADTSTVKLTPAKPAAATTPASKPTSTASAQTGDKTKDMATFAKANPTLAAAAAERARTRGTSSTTNPLMKDMKSRLPAATPKVAPSNTLGNTVAAASKPAAFSPTPAAAKTTPTPVTPKAPTLGSKKPGSMVSHFDPFDVVKGHLLDEGYADTEESALAIMANMSEEWRESIVEGEEDYRPLPRRKMLNKANKLRKSGDVNKKAKSADIEYQLRAHSPEASKTSSYVNRAYGRGSDS